MLSGLAGFLRRRFRRHGEFEYGGGGVVVAGPVPQALLVTPAELGHQETPEVALFEHVSRVGGPVQPEGGVGYQAGHPVALPEIVILKPVPQDRKIVELLQFTNVKPASTFFHGDPPEIVDHFRFSGRRPSVEQHHAEDIVFHGESPMPRGRIRPPHRCHDNARLRSPENSCAQSADQIGIGG